MKSNQPHRFRWTPEQDALLGKLSDQEAAQALGRKLSTVRARRERREANELWNSMTSSA